jgi:hypothetical protein
MNLLQDVIDALNACKGDWPSIAAKANVSYSWLTKLAQLKIPNPGVKTIERLYQVLLPEQFDKCQSDRRANRRGSK